MEGKQSYSAPYSEGSSYSKGASTKKDHSISTSGWPWGPSQSWPESKKTIDNEDNAIYYEEGISYSEKTSGNKFVTNNITTIRIERTSNMSYVHAIKKFNRIIFASESRSVNMYKVNNDKTGQIEEYVVDYSDDFQKIEYLPNAQIGIAAAGNNCIDNMPITIALLEFDAKSEWNCITMEEKVRKIADFLRSKIEINESINIVCGGYDGEEAQLLYSYIKKEDPISIQNSPLMWSTKSHMINLFADNTGLNVKLNSIKAMINFSDFVVKSEIGIAEFSYSVPKVGGPIQTLLLEPTGPKWIHKLH